VVDLAPPIPTNRLERLPAVRLSDSVGLPTQIGPGADPRKLPTSLQAQFRIVTHHTLDPPPFGRRSRIIQPEYDLAEIGKATDTDGLLRRAFDAHVTCIMKDGFNLVGRNERAKDYIQRRLDEISYMSQMSFAQILRQASQDLVEFHNFFIYYVRNPSRSSGDSITYHGKPKEPIAALHPIDVTTMFPVMGDTVEIRSWMQFMDGRHVTGRQILMMPDKELKGSRRFPVEDVLHGWHRRRSGFIFGTPSAIPVLDDIRALRRLEEIAELIVHKHAFPLVHLQVGTETMPARILGNGVSEVDLIRGQYEAIPLEGAIVTSERVSIEAIKVEAQELDGLLAHYERRAITGLGVSDMDLGRGATANRGTAVVLSRSLMDRCREYQRTLSEFFSGPGRLFDILLMEGGFPLTAENRVFLMFPEVDLDRRMAIQNHAMALYQGHVVSETEARLMMGRDPIQNDQRGDMFFERIEKPRAIIQAVDEPFTAEAKNATKAATTSKNQPTNQNGTKPSKGSPVNVRVRGANRLTDPLRQEFGDYVTECMRGERQISDDELRNLASEHGGAIEERLLKYLVPFLKQGFEMYQRDSASPTTFFVGEPLRTKFARRCIQDSIGGLLAEDGEIGELITRLRTATTDHMLEIASFFTFWEGRWDRYIARLEIVAQRFGYAQAAWIDDAHEVGWALSETPCSRCQELQDQRITPRNMNFHTLLGRDCVMGLQIADSNRLPGRVDLRVESFVSDNGAHWLQLRVPERDDFLDLETPGRFVRIFLDSQESAVLPEEATGGWDYEGSGLCQIPKFESGIAELWSDGRVVGRARFEAATNGVPHGHEV
jgi:hypothetical protein